LTASTSNTKQTGGETRATRRTGAGTWTGRDLALTLETESPTFSANGLCGSVSGLEKRGGSIGTAEVSSGLGKKGRRGCAIEIGALTARGVSGDSGGFKRAASKRLFKGA
jgi:hypothetical protein